MTERGILLVILGLSALFYIGIWLWLHKINENLIQLREDIFGKVEEEAQEANKDAAAIKRRQTWSRRRELKTLREEKRK